MFDYKTIYEEKIKPSIDEIQQACMFYGIPFFACCPVKDDGKTTTYQNTLISAKEAGTFLSDDQILKHINVANGFDTIIHKDTIDLEYIAEGIQEEDL